MSARASARTFSARASLRAFRERCSHGGEHDREPGQRQQRHRQHLGQLAGAGSAGRPPGRTPRRPGRVRRSPAPAPASRRWRRRAPATTLPPASARQLLLRGRVGLPPDQSRTGAGERHRPEEPLADSPSPLVWTSHSSPVPSAASATRVPQSTRRLGLAVSRMPARLAASRPGAVVGGRAAAAATARRTPARR